MNQLAVMGGRMEKSITYNISPEEVTYIQDHTFNFLYEKTLYWLFSERMPFLCPFLKRKKKERVALEELLEYCRNHQIEIYPMTIRRNRLLTDIAACYEMLQMKRKGLLIFSRSPLGTLIYPSFSLHKEICLKL